MPRATVFGRNAVLGLPVPLRAFACHCGREEPAWPANVYGLPFMQGGAEAGQREGVTRVGSKGQGAYARFLRDVWTKKHPRRERSAFLIVRHAHPLLRCAFLEL